MPQNFYPIIVMYTFSDDKDRADFKAKLEAKYEIEQLNESTYAVNSVNYTEVERKLHEFCKEIDFKENEFVSMFYAAALADYTEKKYRDRIIGIQIGGE